MNKKFENNLETISAEFLENLQKYEEVICIHHTDADGFASGSIIDTVLYRLKKNHRLISFNLKISWISFFTNILKSAISFIPSYIGECSFGKLKRPYPRIFSLRSATANHLYIV